MKEVLYDWGGLNIWLFHLVNGVHGGAIDAFMQLGTALGSHGLFPLYLGLTALFAVIVVERARGRDGYALARPWLAALAVFSLAYACDGIVVGWLKDWLAFPRPASALPPGSVHIVGTPEYWNSLPSGHSVFAITVAASLWPVCARRGRIALLCYVLWVGVSRVSLGMHFPADVLAGYLCGGAVVIVLRAAVSATLRSTTAPDR